MIFQEKGCIWETELPTGVNNIFNGRTLVYGQTFATIKLAKLKSFRNEIFDGTVGHSVLGITLNNNSHLLTAEISNIPPNKQSLPFFNPPIIHPKQIFHPPCFIRTHFSIFNRLLVTGIDKKYSKQNIRKKPAFKTQQFLDKVGFEQSKTRSEKETKTHV